MNDSRHGLANEEPSAPSDNAGGGLRGTRAIPNGELWRVLHAYYGLDTSSPPVDLGGSSSLNLLVGTGDTRYVTRVYRPYVSGARLDAIQRARNVLSAHGVPCATPLQTLDGHTWVTLRDRVLEVEPYVKHDGFMDSPEKMAIGLPLLGRMHSILREIKVNSEGQRPLFANYLSPKETGRMTLKGCSRLRGWMKTDYHSELANCAEKLAELVISLDGSLLPDIPKQMVHGDFWHNNVLFVGDTVALVTDFDFMGERMRIDDLALMLYFAQDYRDIDASSDAFIKQVVWLTRIYEQGLDIPLSEAERRAIPLTLARQPLWSVGGWIALLDDEQAALRHASDMLQPIQWSLDILRNLDTWQAALLDARQG